jgi:hypothetical protein
MSGLSGSLTNGGTGEFCGANSFDYLAELARHASEATPQTADWMPWNYRETLAGLASPPSTTSQLFLTRRGRGRSGTRRFWTLAERTPDSH